MYQGFRSRDLNGAGVSALPLEGSNGPRNRSTPDMGGSFPCNCLFVCALLEAISARAEVPMLLTATFNRYRFA
ncbi:CG14219-like protein [Anopheles sinensis]|uniref:CG14219-like protein n=1 Tax=Anopheles sinensis TaxID=74873 RepID=A0A084W304_ANOSI|nr:CG14219-like protein [Anopheles sinensis]